jgi:CelD/BcsL family acetyltransferase involved in cellulose biosynthesis
VAAVAITPRAGGLAAPARIAIAALDDPAWSAFVAAQQEATIFHHPTWTRIIADTYGYRAFALHTTDARGKVVAGLPVVAIRGVRGTSMVSLPFTDHCPPLAQNAASFEAFVDGLVAWRQEVGSRVFDVRAELPARPGIYHSTPAVRHVLSLDGGPTALLKLSRTPAHRAMRKAKRAGVAVRITQSPDDLSELYRLHWQTRQRQGVPVQPRRFFEAIWARLIERDLGFVVLAAVDDRPIAAAMFLAWNGQLIYKYGASDARYWALRPNNLVMWTAIEEACARGYRLLDFGKTELNNQGLREFKRRWDALETPLTYSCITAKPPRASSDLPGRLLSQLVKHSPRIVCRATGELLYGRFGATL